MDYGFIRVAAATPRVWLADTVRNAQETVRLCREIAVKAPSVIVFPELGVTGYSCADLFGQQALVKGAEEAVAEIAAETASLDAVIVVGTPVAYAGRLFNCAAVIRHGELLALVPKQYLPASGEFYEYRWFETGSVLSGKASVVKFAGFECVMDTDILFEIGGTTAAIEICQDLWVPVPPSSYSALAGAELILNLSASNEAIGKHDYRKMLVCSTAARLNAAYVYCSCGYGESTQDLVWAGSSLIYESGNLLAENQRFASGSTYIITDIDSERLRTIRQKSPNFKDYSAAAADYCVIDCGAAAATDFEQELLRYVEAHPFVPGGDAQALTERCREIFSIQVLGLMTRLEHVHCKTAVLGISGGLDSTLALLVSVLAADRLGWDRSRVIGVTMPGFGTTGRTYNNALSLMRKLGITIREISIAEASAAHLQNIGHGLEDHDLTYENAQARERMQVLMDIAGMEGGLVVGTGDLSELALGWCTYNADHMSMYGVNASIPKTLVRTLVGWAAEEYFAEAGTTLKDILDTPVSPELLPPSGDGTISQVTEDIVGPYELHDFYLYNIFRWGYSPAKVLLLAQKAFGKAYDRATIVKWMRIFIKRYFSQQFKRSCLPDAPKVGSVSLSPRGDLRMPSDALSDLWINELDNL